MKNSNYKSVPVIASVIGSKSRKSMYLVNITSLDGKKIYNNAWVPTAWNDTTRSEWRYTRKVYNERSQKFITIIDNALIEPGKYYKFHFKESVLMTTSGPVNEFGGKLDVEGLKKVKLSVTRRSIEWEEHSQELVEFPLKKATPSMLIPQQNNKGTSPIKQRLVNGNIEKFLQLEDRYIIYLPVWFIQNLKLKFQSAYSVDDELFSNEEDTNTESIIEETAYNSKIAEQFSYIDRREMDFQVIDSLTQWELDNPEYLSFE